MPEITDEQLEELLAKARQKVLDESPKDLAALAEVTAPEMRKQLRYCNGKWWLCTGPKSVEENKKLTLGTWCRTWGSGENAFATRVLRRYKKDVSKNNVEQLLFHWRNPLRLDGANLDGYPMLLATANGAVDLETGDLFKTDISELMLTRAAPIPFNKDAECPHWLAHLKRLFVADWETDWFQQALGAGLIGDSNKKPQIFVVLTGPEGNGKGTVARVLTHVLGQDQVAVSMSADDLTSGGLMRHTQWLTRLDKARLAIVNDLRKGQLNDGLIKNLSGGDTLVANKMRQNDEAWEPTHTLFMTSNWAPNFGSGDDTEGMRRRYRPLRTGPTITDEEMAADPEWEEKIYAEAEGILAWVIEGCRKWYAGGQDKRMKWPQMAPWIEEDITANDPAAMWINECVTFDKKQSPRTNTLLHNEYMAWFNKKYGSDWLTRGGVKPVNPDALGRALAAGVRRQGLNPDDYRSSGKDDARKSFRAWHVAVVNQV